MNRTYLFIGAGILIFIVGFVFGTLFVFFSYPQNAENLYEQPNREPAATMSPPFVQDLLKPGQSLSGFVTDITQNSVSLNYEWTNPLNPQEIQPIPLSIAINPQDEIFRLESVSTTGANVTFQSREASIDDIKPGDFLMVKIGDNNKVFSFSSSP